MVCLSFIAAWVVLLPSRDTKHSLFDVQARPECESVRQGESSGCSLAPQR